MIYIAATALILLGIFVGCFLIAVVQTASMADQLRNRSAESVKLEAERYKATMHERYQHHLDLTPASLPTRKERRRQRQSRLN